MRFIALAVFCLALAAGCSGRRSEQKRIEGDTYLRLGKVNNACAAYESAAKINPDNHLAVLGMAKCYVLQQKPDEALAAYRRVMERDPSTEDAYVGAARVLLGQGQTEEAIAMAREFEETNREQGGLLRAYVLKNMGKPEEALDALEALRDEFPKSAVVRVQLAYAFLFNAQTSKAEQELQYVLDEIDPHSFLARMALIEVYQAEGKTPEIVAQFETLLENEPDNTELQLLLARSLLNDGQFDRAESIARPVLEKHPDNGWANYVVGCCLLEQESFPEALQCLQTAVQAMPNQEIVRGALELARDRKKFSEGFVIAGHTPIPAKSSPTDEQQGPDQQLKGWQQLWNTAELKQLLAQREDLLKDSPPEALEALVVTALILGSDPLAADMAQGLPESSPLKGLVVSLGERDPSKMKQAIDAWPEEESEARVVRDNAVGLVYTRIGARAQALRLLSETYQAVPENVVALSNLAQMYESARMPQFAARCLQRLLERYPSALEPRLMLYAALNSAGLEKEAMESAFATYASYPSRPEAIYNLSQAYLTTGQTERAFEVLRLGAGRNPDQPVLRLALAGALLRVGKANAGLELLDAGAAASDESGQVTALLASAYAQLGQWDQVVDLWRDADVDGLSLAARLGYASALISQGQTAQAGDVLLSASGKPIVPFPPENAILGALGRLSHAELADVATNELVSALAQQPDVLAQFTHATSCLRAQQYQPAVTALEKVADMIGRSPLLVSTQMTCLAKGAEIPGRLEKAKALLDANEEMPDAWLGIADVYKSVDDVAAEREAPDSALALAPDNRAVLQRRARFFEAHGDEVAALDAYRRLHELDPEDAVVMNNLAYSFLRQNQNTEEALSLALAARDKLGANGHVLHTLGLAEMRNGQLDQGRADLSYALELRPGDPTLLLDFGDLLIKQGHEEEGKRYVELALEYARQLGLDFPRKAEAERIAGKASSSTVQS